MEEFGAIGLDQDDPLYMEVEAANGSRHYEFLHSMIDAANKTGKRELTHALIKAINFHAIAGLHMEAGIYRPVPVMVGDLDLPDHTEVPDLMDQFIKTTNTIWESTQFVTVATYALWGLNRIHPFVNGNGRTARAVCYYIISTSIGVLLPGNPILPEQFRLNHDQYVDGPQQADLGNFEPLITLTTTLLSRQLASAGPGAS